ncbi:MAG: caspase family protein [Planctomycetes bacterium]|nr:caspase family protein [Planctomycetota bacterium]
MKRALLVAGGIDRRQNHPRYRNDLAAFYRLLVQERRYDRQDVRVHLGPGAFEDLDGDGEVEECRPATRREIIAGFEWLAMPRAEDDIAFLVVSNHGDDEGLCPWGLEDVVRPADLEQPFRGSLATKVFVFGQCHAGIFSRLSLPRSVVLCACSQDEPSHACPEPIEYDEFLYHLVAALAGQYPDRASSPPGSVPSGIATIEDAFNYASAMDRMQETPLLSDPDGLAGGVSP